MTKREEVLRTLRGEKTDRVPVGFWFHFNDDPVEDGLRNPEVIRNNLKGEEKFFREFHPDIVKIMTDGFFLYPNEVLYTADSAKELAAITPLPDNHPWFTTQVKYAKQVLDIFGGEVLNFYNMFAPATIFRFGREGQNKKSLAALAAEDSGAVEQAFSVVAGDLARLAKLLLQEAGVDGLYYSTQDPNDAALREASRLALYTKQDKAVLNAAALPDKYHILHVCGYAGWRNNLAHFADYPVQAVNFASTVEGVTLSQGKKLFGSKTVIGGFVNTKDGILYRGSEAEVKAETRRLLQEAGTAGIILGADCTVPADIDWKRLNWVREAAQL
jgi:uroporphyrinogen decarboxylase